MKSLTKKRRVAVGDDVVVVYLVPTAADALEFASVMRQLGIDLDTATEEEIKAVGDVMRDAARFTSAYIDNVIGEEDGEPVFFEEEQKRWRELGAEDRERVTLEYAGLLLWPVVPKLVEGASMNALGESRGARAS